MNEQQEEQQEQIIQNPFQDALSTMLVQSTRSQEYADLGDYSHEPEYLSGYRGLREALEKALKELDIMQRHQHEYNENSYCNICGRDGRA